MIVLTAVTTVLAAAVFLIAAGMKFTGEAHSLRARDGLGVAPSSWLAIGALEVAGAIGALIGLAHRPLGVAALTGLVLVSLGALAANRRLSSSAEEFRPAVIALALAAAALVLQIATA
jgi:hypothetical protein